MGFWITCQLGAREHYAIPRALHPTGQLHTLITDAWVTPQSPLHALPSKVATALGDRYHSDLASASVQSFTPSLLSFELRQRLTKTSGWPSMMARNHWFQRHALRALKQLTPKLALHEEPTLFCYSYTALSLFQYAKQQGWQRILGQIDPGILEEKRVAELQTIYGQQYRSSWTCAPEHYWQDWQQECALADRIIVNSPWSQSALATMGIPEEKMAIAPLAYQPPIESTRFVRQYPPVFTQTRPLRVLFLGQIILRKGIAALLEALPQIQGEPIEIWLVGSTELTLPDSLLTHPQLKWMGPVPRSRVQDYYRDTDVFLFPTHSDGFGLTQLEAQAWHLPIIASRHCGPVVSHQQNGLILPEVTSKSITHALLTCCRNPEFLRHWAAQSIDMNAYSLSQLARTLQTLI